VRKKKRARIMQWVSCARQRLADVHNVDVGDDEVRAVVGVEEF
jgi:hypothetical protein